MRDTYQSVKGIIKQPKSLKRHVGNECYVLNAVLVDQALREITVPSLHTVRRLRVPRVTVKIFYGKVIMYTCVESIMSAIIANFFHDPVLLVLHCIPIIQTSVIDLLICFYKIEYIPTCKTHLACTQCP